VINFTQESPSPGQRVPHILLKQKGHHVGPSGQAVWGEGLDHFGMGSNPAYGMDVCLYFCVLLSCVARGLCDGLITRSKESVLPSVLIRLKNLPCEETKVLSRTVESQTRRKMKICYSVPKNPPLAPILSHVNPVHSLTSHFPNIHIKITLLSAQRNL
jgi:hypothetical protein